MQVVVPAGVLVYVMARASPTSHSLASVEPGASSPLSTSQLKSLTSPRLKYNAILNSVTAKGPFVANNAAILALLYNLVHGAMIRGRDGKWDVGSAVGSAALVGTIFKSTAGWKSALKTGGVLGTAMLVYQMADTAYDQYQRHNY